MFLKAFKGFSAGFKPGVPKLESSELSGVNRRDIRHERLNSAAKSVPHTLLLSNSYPRTYNQIFDPLVIGEKPAIPLPSRKQWHGLQSTLNQQRVSRTRAWQVGGKTRI